MIEMKSDHSIAYDNKKNYYPCSIRIDLEVGSSNKDDGEGRESEIVDPRD